MSKSLGIVEFTAIGIGLTIILCLFVHCFTEESIEKNDSVTFPSFIVLTTNYNKSTGIITVDIKYKGENLKPVSKNDFNWYLEDKNMGNVKCILFFKENKGELHDGDTFQIQLEVEKLTLPKKITITHKGGSNFDFSIKKSE